MTTSRTAIENLAEGLAARPVIALAARLLVALPFLISGIAKLADFGGAIAEVRGLTGLEPAALFAVLVIVTQIGGSALVIAGARLAWLGAGALAVFTVIATLLAHAWWRMPLEAQFANRNIFFEHVAIVGGLILVAVLASPHRGAR